MISDERRREVQRLQELQREELQRAYAYVMGSPLGRLFVRDVLAATQWDTEAMTGNSQTFHNLGAQKVGRAVRDALIAHDRTAWRLLEDEDARDAARMKAALET